MKANKLFLTASLVALTFTTQAQLETLPPSICESYKPNGWIFFNEGSIAADELFDEYKPHFFTDPNNQMTIDRIWEDSWIGLKHRHYQQSYNGIVVEGRGFIEHIDRNGNIVYANGKICSQIGRVYTQNVIDSREALQKALERYEYNQWSWNSPEFEAQYKDDLEDTLATSYPSGKLVFTMKDMRKPIQYDQNPSDYVLAWKFEVYSLIPSIHVEIYIDAVTGEFIKYMDLVKHDGLAEIPFHGTQNLDTRWEGWPTSAHILRTNDMGRNVHTKYDGLLSWGLTSEIEDEDGTWGTSEQGGTAAHWGVTQAWDYFKNKHDRDGLDGSGGKVRVLCESNDRPGAWYDKIAGIDRVYAGFGEGDIYLGEISILAHEFTHGVNAHSGELVYLNESGALDESFADIFGFMTRHYATGSMSWEIGVPTSVVRERRSLLTPKSLGFHFDLDLDEMTVEEGVGQPDTYEGEFWFPWDEAGNDQGGVHINSGVQNHWFYILSQGKTGTNDIGNSYVVYGIGIEKAAEIAYYNLTSHMEESSQYEDAMIGAIHAAALKWGECSFEHIETQDAWYAVGLGEWSYCYGAGIDEESRKTFNIYPNPVEDFATIEFFTDETKTIQIYANNGQLLRTFKNVNDMSYVMDLSYLAKGSYFISVIGTETQNSIIIKQ